MYESPELLQLSASELMELPGAKSQDMCSLGCMLADMLINEHLFEPGMMSACACLCILEELQHMYSLCQ